MILRSLRGILRTTIAAGLTWTALGFLIGVVFRPVGAPADYVVLGRAVPGFVAACTLAGALVGIVNGLTFVFLVIATERGKNIGQLRGWRMAAWGALATGGPVGLLLQSPLIAAIGAGVGAAGAIGALWAARRAPDVAGDPRWRIASSEL